MEITAEQSCDSVDNDQDDSSSCSCSCNNEQCALPTKKRSANFFSNDQSSLPKYRKLSKNINVTPMEEEKTAYAVLVSDISSDEFSNPEVNNNSQEDASESMPNELSEGKECSKIYYKEEKYLENSSEYEGRSIDISPQKELQSFESEEKIFKQKEKFMQTKFPSSIIRTSQFSCNDESEKNITTVNNSPSILNQSNSQMSNSYYVKEEIQQKIINAELPNISDCKEIIPDVDQENNMKILLSNKQFTVIKETGDKNSNIIIKQNNSIVDESEIQFGIGVQNNISDVNNSLSQNYIEENGISHKSSHFYSSENLHQSSNRKESAAEQNISSETSTAHLVLNLTQLVLSLKNDIKGLSEKIERQEKILRAVTLVNEISIAPLFNQSFPEKYNLKVPFSTIEEFDKFNQDLAKDQNFCNEFITSLCSYVDNNVTLAKNILTMMKNYTSKDLVALYNASKATANKMVLKDTLFCKCMLQATRMTVRNGLLPLEHEKAFIKGLSIVVSGAKGWHTHEEERK